MTTPRRLAAILAADVAGYSRLMGEDEVGTAQAVRESRDAVAPIVASHGGRIVKTMGDGVLLEFPSVVAAVECAIAVQKLMAERNADVPQDKRIVYRIGVHLGDVLIEGEDILGDGVNIAARLEGIAKPGAICLSEDAYRQVRGRLDLKVNDLGPTQLKNIAEPIRIYSLQIGAPAQAKSPVGPAAAKATKPLLRALVGAALVALVGIGAGAWYFLGANRSAPSISNAVAPAEPAHLSIVVLPFTNLSGDPNQDYFADGVTENLTTDLSRIPKSFVIARNTAFTFKGKNVDAKEIGKELGVRYVLEGSVQRDQNRVRVNAQLIDAESGAHLWADRFEEDVADLFKLQDQIVARLTNTLGIELVKAEAQRGARASNPDAVDLTMRGWGLVRDGALTKDKLEGARALFEQALKLDPNNANALAGDAYTYVDEYVVGWTSPAIDYDVKILGQADRAIALAPETLWAYYVKCVYLYYSQRADAAVSAADAGLAINPNSGSLLAVRGNAELFSGRYQQAKSDILQAMRLSPREPLKAIGHKYLGDSELGLGQFDAAIDEYHKSIDLGFRTAWPYASLTAAYALPGKMEEARSALAEARRLEPKLSIKWLVANHAPNLPPLFEGLRKAGLPEDSPAEPAHLSIVVLPFANLSGDPNQDYFADGVTENLTTDLSRIPKSFVIARNTAFTFKGKNLDAKEIGKQLGVRYVLEGSVQRDQNRVRVNAQLIDAESGAHLWADRFEEEVADLFKLQNQIVARLGNVLGFELVKAEAEKSAGSNNPDAIDLAMRGWAKMWQSYSLSPKEKEASHKAALAFFDQALKFDALAGDAFTYMAGYIFGWASTEADLDAKIIDQADRAIALAPDNMRAYYAKSSYLNVTHRANEALRAADAGLAINPNYAPLLDARAFAETALGRFEQAKNDTQQAMQLSPRDPESPTRRLSLGMAELGLGNFDAAIVEYQKSIDAGAHSFIPYANLAAAYALEGKTEEAKSALTEARRLNPKLTVTWLIDHAPNVPPLFDGLRKAGLPEDAPAEATHLSIVVLPFTNLSGDPSQDYFADGVTENLTTDLSRIPKSFVIARNTAFTFKGKNLDAKEIGKELGVRYVLEGSVQRDQGRVRVNAQLIDAESGAHVWADRFDENVADLFKLQDEVVARLSNSLGWEIVKAEAERGARSKNPNAIDLNMRGDVLMKTLLQSGNPKETLHAARALFEQALAIDPNDPYTLTHLGFTYYLDYYFEWGASDTDYDAKVLGQADRAINLDPNFVNAYSLKCYYLNSSGRSNEGFRAADEGGSRSFRITRSWSTGELTQKSISAGSSKRRLTFFRRCG
jgi:TolB-like protein/class 3 adenylate cyclase/Flp pilus assembly protein TadD